MRKLLAALALGAVFAFAAPDVAEAQVVVGDGLVNVVIGDVTILEDVNVAVAANIVAGICAQDVNVAVLAAIDDGAPEDFSCEAARGRIQEVEVTQN